MKTILVDRHGNKLTDFDINLTDEGEPYEVIEWDSKIFIFWKDLTELFVYKQAKNRMGVIS